MTRKAYLAALIRLYLAAQGSPKRASRADWAIATTLYGNEVSLERIAHAIRLSYLRRNLVSPPRQATPDVRSLAYYRAVLQRLSSEELENGYVAYVERTYRNLSNRSRDEAEDSKTALSQPANRAS